MTGPTGTEPTGPEPSGGGRTVGRPPAPIPDDTDEAAREFAEALRQLADDSGMNYDSIARHSSYHPATISRAAGGKTVPTKDVFEGFVTACDGDVEALRPLWRRAQESRNVEPEPVITPVPAPPSVAPPPPGPPPSGTTPDPPRRPTRIQIAIAVAVVLVVVLLVVPLTGRAEDDVLPSPRACGATSIVVELGGVEECVGRVSDTDTMPPALRPVLDAINNENARIAAGDPAVAVAYMLPVPAASGAADAEVAAVATTRYARELDGALRAQRRANDTSTVGDRPKVRVIFYNVGRDGASWVQVLNNLQRAVVTDRVVAVAGLGPGVGGAGALTEALSELSIPVFRAGASADRLTVLPTDPPGLFRTTATSNQLASAAAAQLGGARAVQVVQDIRADNADAASLGQNFTAARTVPTGNSGANTPEPIVYDSSLGPADGTFDNGLASSCSTTSGSATGPDAFFVAGRGPQLAEFLVSLSDSSCREPSGPVTVLAGPEGASVVEQLRQALAADVPRSPQAQQLVDAFTSGKFRFRYLALAHPGQWDTQAFAENYTDTINSFADLRSSTALQGADELVGYDAVLAAITCARAAVSQSTPDPTAGTVLASCATDVTAARPVYGAGGPIAFDTPGRTTTASIPVVDVRPDGTAPMVRTGP